MYENLTAEEREVLRALNNGQTFGPTRTLKLLETISELRGELAANAPPAPSLLDVGNGIVSALDALVTPDIK